MGLLPTLSGPVRKPTSGGKPKQLVVLSLSKCEVVIGQLTVFLFQFAFHFVPTAFDLKICHSNK